MRIVFQSAFEDRGATIEFLIVRAHPSAGHGDETVVAGITLEEIVHRSDSRDEMAVFGAVEELNQLLLVGRRRLHVEPGHSAMTFAFGRTVVLKASMAWA